MVVLALPGWQLGHGVALLPWPSTLYKSYLTYATGLQMAVLASTQVKYVCMHLSATLFILSV